MPNIKKRHEKQIKITDPGATTFFLFLNFTIKSLIKKIDKIMKISGEIETKAMKMNGVLENAIIYPTEIVSIINLTKMLLKYQKKRGIK